MTTHHCNIPEGETHCWCGCARRLPRQRTEAEIREAIAAEIEAYATSVIGNGESVGLGLIRAARIARGEKP